MENGCIVSCIYFLSNLCIILCVFHGIISETYVGNRMTEFLSKHNVMTVASYL